MSSRCKYRGCKTTRSMKLKMFRIPFKNASVWCERSGLPVGISNEVLKNFVICEKHFPPNNILRSGRLMYGSLPFQYEGGTEIELLEDKPPKEESEAKVPKEQCEDLTLMKASISRLYGGPSTMKIMKSLFLDDPLPPESHTRVDNDAALQPDANALAAKMSRVHNSSSSADIETEQIAGPSGSQEIVGPSETEEIAGPSNIESQPCSSSSIQFEASELMAHLQNDVEFGVLKESGLGNIRSARLESAQAQALPLNKEAGEESSLAGNETGPHRNFNPPRCETQPAPNDTVSSEDDVVVVGSIDTTKALYQLLTKQLPDNQPVIDPQPLTKSKRQSENLPLRSRDYETQRETSDLQLNIECHKLNESSKRLDENTKRLESSICTLQSVSSKLIQYGSLGDKYDQFGKYISSLLRGLPAKKVNSLKKQIVWEVLEALHEVEKGSSETRKTIATQTCLDDPSMSHKDIERVKSVSINTSSLTNVPVSVDGKKSMALGAISSATSSNLAPTDMIQTDNNSIPVLNGGNSISTGAIPSVNTIPMLSGANCNPMNSISLANEYPILATGNCVSTNTIPIANTIPVFTGGNHVPTDTITFTNNFPVFGGNVPIIIPGGSSSSSFTLLPVVPVSASPRASVSAMITTPSQVNPVMSASIPLQNSNERITTVAQSASGTLLAVSFPKPQISEKDQTARIQNEKDQPMILAKKGQKRKQPITTAAYLIKKCPQYVPSSSGSLTFSQSIPQTTGNIITQQCSQGTCSESSFLSHGSSVDQGGGPPGSSCQPEKQNKDNEPDMKFEEGPVTAELKQEHEYFEAILREEGHNSDVYIKEEVDLDMDQDLKEHPPSSTLSAPPPSYHPPTTYLQNQSATSNQGVPVCEEKTTEKDVHLFDVKEGKVTRVEEKATEKDVCVFNEEEVEVIRVEGKTTDEDEGEVIRGNEKNNYGTKVILKGDEKQICNQNTHELQVYSDKHNEDKDEKSETNEKKREKKKCKKKCHEKDEKRVSNKEREIKETREYPECSVWNSENYEESDEEENEAVKIACASMNPSGKRKRTKQHCCKFCHKLIVGIGRHITTVHKEELEIAQILCLSKKKRKECLEQIEREGDYIHNKEVLATKKGELILVRRPTASELLTHTYEDYGPCTGCLGFMLKNHLWHHVRYGCKAVNNAKETPFSVRVGSDALLAAGVD